MSRPFIDEDFLLGSRTARRLYHDFAERLPIIDFHCHIPAAEIATDRRFENLTQIWLAGDHYKWRAMRACGVDERYITGDATDWEKFQKWAETVPKTIRNPLFHWTHLELKKPFGISNRILNSTSARGIWEECNERLADPAFSVRGLQKQFNVEVVCTTDDASDDLKHHRAIAGLKGQTPKVSPTFRADAALAVENGDDFVKYIRTLSKSAGVRIRTFADFMEALRRRHEFFNRAGCRLSDHGLETMYAESYSEREVNTIFRKVLGKKRLNPIESAKLKSAMLHEMAVEDWEKGWVQQFHLGALREVNSRMTKKLGPASGFDSIGDGEIARSLGKFLDDLDRKGKLAKTILYNINPRDNDVFATMAGNFQDGSTPGKIQFGPAWWFLDQMDGMTKQIESLSNMGVLSQFVGMVTDSRSLLSYSRHEYFRRILCNILGGEMERGVLPDDIPLIGGMVKGICYSNAKRYFEFP